MPISHSFRRSDCEVQVMRQRGRAFIWVVVVGAHPPNGGDVSRIAVGDVSHIAVTFG